MNLHKFYNSIQDGETFFISIIIQIAPWLAPIAPAYMAFYNLTSKLKFYPIIAVAVAMTIEMLGIATINTALMFWRHNLKYKDPKRKSPVWIPTFAFITYLVIVLSINVLLELETLSVYIPVIVKAFLTFLSIPAALTLAVRLQHTELVADIALENAERRNATHKQIVIAQVHAQPALEPSQSIRIEPHICGNCGRGFAKQPQLAAHMRVHKRTNGHKPELIELSS